MSYISSTGNLLYSGNINQQYPGQLINQLPQQLLPKMMLSESLANANAAQIVVNHPYHQKSIPHKQMMMNHDSLSSYSNDFKSMDFKYINSNHKNPVQLYQVAHKRIPNQVNQTVNIPKYINQNINSSLSNSKQFNHSINHQSNKQKPQSSPYNLTSNSNLLLISQLHNHPDNFSQQPPPKIQFHPSYFLLSKFPQLIPKDQIYLPVINRLQAHETKHCFHQLYINLKFLLIQSQTQFWKYLSHLHFKAMNGLSDDEVRQGYKVRLALESCLMNFSIKEFNKCVSTEQIKSSTAAVSKRIYQYENIFNSISFQLYDKLFQTVIEFFERLVKTKNPLEISIITNSWYIDTLKIMQLATIYGNKQPSRVKQLIKKMFLLNPKVYTQDFVNFIKKLHQYIEPSSSSSNTNDNLQESFSLFQHLHKKIQAVSNNHKNNRSNFHNPQKYFGRELFFVCSDCLKLFIYVTNVFKFFPSRIKLIFMENIDFLRVLIKISVRVVYNLRVEQAQKKRWKMSQKLRSLMKDMEFALLQKITEMYKFIFLNTKNALQQQLFDRQSSAQQQQRTTSEIKQQRTVLRFYKKLIDGTVNRKKDAEKDKNIMNFLEQQYNNNESNVSHTVQTQVNHKNEVSEKSQPKSQRGEQPQELEKKGEKQQNEHKQLQEKSHQNSTRKQNQSISCKQHAIKKKKELKILQNEYGRVLIKHLLRKQLKKDSKKYTSVPYFYTRRLYDYFSCKYRNSESKWITKKKESNQCQGSSEDRSIEMMQRGFMKNLLVLQEFQNEVKSEHFSQMQSIQKYTRLDLTLRQLPTLQQFRVKQQHLQLNQLLKKLTNTSNSFNKQYQDEPTDQQQLQMIEWTERILDEDDFTRITQDSIMNNDSEILDFNHQNAKEVTYSNNNDQNDHGFNNRNSFQMTEQWMVFGRRRVDNNRERDSKMKNRRRCFQGQSSEQLSPQEITEQQLANQQKSMSSTSMMGKLIMNPTSNNATTIIDPKNSNGSKFSTSSFLSTTKHPIFKPHQSLNKLSHSMIKQQLQYFNKIKGLNWHEISRISVSNNNKKSKSHNNNNSSYDEVLQRFDKLIKVQDIGLSFDMILSGSDYDDEKEQNMHGGYEHMNSNNFSYFYYNQWKHQSTRRKKKSFMEDYEWSQSHVNSSNQHHHINHDKQKHKQNKCPSNHHNNQQIHDDNQQPQSQYLRFKKKYIPKKLQTQESAGKIGDNSQQQSYEYQGVGSFSAQKQLFSTAIGNSNGKNAYRYPYQEQIKTVNNGCYVRRDYANYVSTNNSNSNYYNGSNADEYYYPMVENYNQQYPNYTSPNNLLTKQQLNHRK